MQDTLKHFAQLAHDLGLDPITVEHASETQVQDFARQVLTELVALGLLPDTQPGCYTHYAGRAKDA